MALYPDDFKNYLKDTVNIADVIAMHVPDLQKIGNSYMGTCPFHSDDSPSLQVKPDKQAWGCFGCGAGSKHHSKATSADVYGFIKGYYGYNLGQAIEWLAKFMNVPLPVLDAKQQFKMNQHKNWVNRCNQSQERFVANLLKNKDALKYLYNRGIGDTEIVLWGLGFGDGEDQDFANTKGKITFPIYNYEGDIISFTGRVPFGANILAEYNEKLKLEGKNPIPKYLHRYEITKERHGEEYYNNHPYPKFERNDYLYGIHLAKSYIHSWRTATLVEGFTDVIKLHKHGVHNAIATMGTNLGEKHVMMLKRAGAKRVIVMRDGDSAGIRATENDARILTQHGIECVIMPLPDGHDPDSLCDSFSLYDDSIHKYIQKKTRTLNQWRVEKVFKETQDEILYHYSRIGELNAARLQKVSYVLSTITDPIDKEMLLQQFSDLFNISYESLRDKVEYYQGGKK